MIVAAAVCCLFTVNSVLKGFENQFQDMARGSNADLSVDWQIMGPSLSDIELWMEQMGLSWAPSIQGWGMLKTLNLIGAASVEGVAPEQEMQLAEKLGKDPSVYAGLLDQTSSQVPELEGLLSMFSQTAGSGKPALLGSVLAERFGIDVGDLISLHLLDASGQIETAGFEVVGLFKSGLYEEDAGKVYINIDDARELLHPSSGYSQIQICLGSRSTEEVKAEITKKWPMAQIKAWYEREAILFRAMKNTRLLMGVVLSLIILVASFGILAVQWNFVREKTADIGILRSMGFSRIRIFKIFMGVSWIIGSTGLVLGLLTGSILSLNANEIISTIGWDPFPADIYYHDGIPVTISVLDFIWISVLSISLTTLAGLIPSIKAIRIEPAEAIRLGI